MFQVKNGRIKYSVNKQLTRKQLQRLKYVPSRSVQQYLQSCLGMAKSKVAFVPPQDEGPNDKLVSKPKQATLQLIKDLLRNGHNMNHKPIANNGAWVGVELEFFVPRNDCGIEAPEDYGGDDWHVGSDEVHEAIRDAFRDAGIKRTSVRGDGSIDGNSDDDVGVEVTLLFNSKNGYDQLYKVCRILKTQFNAAVNQSCGMHVHFDFSGQEKDYVKRQGKKILRFMPILSMLVPKSRRDNEYCELDMSGFSGSRYYAINLTSFEKHETIEVRMHSGTLDAKKVECWIELMQLMFKSDYSRESVSTLQGMFDALNMPDRLVEYCERRYSTLNPVGSASLGSSPDVAEHETADMQLTSEAVQAPISGPLQRLVASVNAAIADADEGVA